MVHSCLLDHGGLLEISLLNLFIYALIFGCAGCSLPPVLFSRCGERGLLSGCGAPASPRCGGFSSCRARALLAGFSGCSARAQQLRVPGLWSTGSIVGVHGLSCSTARRIFPGQGLNQCLLHGQGDSLPVSYQGSPKLVNWILLKLKTSAQ